MKFLASERDLLMRISLAVIVFLFFALTLSGFAGTGNVYTILESVSLTALVAVGVSATIIAGEFDLSVGSVAACAGILAVKFVDLGVVPAILIATVGGIFYGIIQGWAIHKLGISSIVFTLGTFIGLRGVAYILSDESTISFTIEQLPISTALRTPILGIFSPVSLVMILACVGLWAVLRYTRLGREIYAIGGARKESRMAGVPQARGLITAFAISGGFASLAGGLASLRAASAAPGNYEWLLLSAVTAALIGGVSLYGGRGSVVGVLVGALMLQFLISGLSLAGAPFWAANFATGLLLVLAILIDLASSGSALRRQFQQIGVARRQRAQQIAEART